MSHFFSILIMSMMFLAATMVAQGTRPTSFHDTLAVVDSWPITTQDLFERIELMPFEEGIRDRDFESIKRKGVESLVGERLLSLHFPARADSNEWHLRIMNTVLLKMFARDAMFKQEIRERVTVRESDVRQGLRRYVVRRQLLVVRPPTSEAAGRFAADWRRRRAKGEGNADVLASVPYKGDTVLISLGSIDAELEEAAFQLIDTTSVSEPVPSKLFGTVVMAMLADVPNPKSAGKSAGEQQQVVRDILRERQEMARAHDFTDQLLRGQRMEADTGLFRVLTRRLWELIRADTVARQVPGGFRYVPEDISRLLSEFRSQLELPLAQGSFGIFRVGEFLANLFYYDYTIPSVRPRSFSVSFFQLLRAMTEAEIIAQEGLRRGYQYKAAVLHDVSKWMDYWKSRLEEASYVEAATVREWEPVHSLWRHDAAVVESTCVLSVQEILRPDSLSASALLQLIHDGSDMDSLARAHSLRSEWRPAGGRSGWFRFRDRKELAGKMMMAVVGETKGPLILREGCSIVRLLGRRFDADSVMIDSLLAREYKRVLMAHRQAAINQAVARLALVRKVEIYYDRIKAVGLSNVNMFTRRFIGFGGRMNAAPVLVPQWQWLEEWKKMRRLMQ
ncbi:MAG: hypothetical protein A2X66_03115 [Ignavibacteria bacterium GWA2_54_16]|nr:MAG: hypothetical protein A2X66_03115 [Ignavibacteria bacterium GWA2_54_16]